MNLIGGEADVQDETQNDHDNRSSGTGHMSAGISKTKSGLSKKKTRSMDGESAR